MTEFIIIKNKIILIYSFFDIIVSINLKLYSVIQF